MIATTEKSGELKVTSHYGDRLTVACFTGPDGDIVELMVEGPNGGFKSYVRLMGDQVEALRTVLEPSTGTSTR